jgi:glutamate N-acetyltransferase/amino-acid N-acetyltransferase
MNKSDHIVIPGFTASAVSAGIQKEGKNDLALFFSEAGATAAGVFTNNKVKAAPVLLSRTHIKSGKARAILANSGCANACTGVTGYEDARRTAELVAEELGIYTEEVLVASTGVIGSFLNIDKIGAAVPGLAKSLSSEGMLLAAEAIMTTDSFPKMSSFDGNAGDRSYRIAGIAKGAGMIMPDMATMLSFIFTDIAIPAKALKKALCSAAGKTFNRITVDGDTSTNDMVLIMANGLANNGPLTESHFNEFQYGLKKVMEELALMIVKDGEGATKVIRVDIRGARSPKDAMHAAKSVANSTLVKTAFYGQDPNWGRIIAALGRAEIKMEERLVDIWINDTQIVSEGLGRGAEMEAKVAETMEQKNLTLTIDLHQGDYEDHMLTCDLTHKYIDINANYRT